MGCAVNAFTGREGELSLERAERRKRVVVVGAGPGGLEAARVACRRGHQVALYEKSRHVGGALLLAATVHPENAPFLDFLRGELRRLPIELHLGQALDADSVAALAPDAVVVATGGRVVAPKLPGDDLPHVVTGAGLRARLGGVLGGRLPGLAGPRGLAALTRAWLPLGRRVAVVGGDLAAVELAEFLAARGRRVAVLEAGDEIAREVGPKRRAEHMDALDRAGVTVHTGVDVERIASDGVVLRAEGASGEGRVVPADSVVLAGELEPDTTLFDALQGRVPEVFAVGDCTGLGLIRKATEDAARAACSL